MKKLQKKKRKKKIRYQKLDVKKEMRVKRTSTYQQLFDYKDYIERRIRSVIDRGFKDYLELKHYEGSINPAIRWREFISVNGPLLKLKMNLPLSFDYFIAVQKAKNLSQRKKK